MYHGINNKQIFVYTGIFFIILIVSFLSYAGTTTAIPKENKAQITDVPDYPNLKKIDYQINGASVSFYAVKYQPKSDNELWKKWDLYVVPPKSQTTFNGEIEIDKPAIIGGKELVKDYTLVATGSNVVLSSTEDNRFFIKLQGWRTVYPQDSGISILTTVSEQDMELVDTFVKSDEFKIERENFKNYVASLENDEKLSSVLAQKIAEAKPSELTSLIPDNVDYVVDSLNRKWIKEDFENYYYTENGNLIAVAHQDTEGNLIIDYSADETKIKKGDTIKISTSIAKASIDKAILKKNQKVLSEQERKKLAYEATWRLLNVVLEKYAYPYVDDMCKVNWNSSEASADDGNGGPGGEIGGDNPGNGGPGACIGTSYAAQLRVTNTQSGYRHAVSYTIRSCDSLIHYQVYLQNPAYPMNTLDNGYVASGQTVSDSITSVFPISYTEVCFNAGEETNCFPAVIS